MLLKSAKYIISREMIENRTRCWNYLYPNISHLFLLSRFTLSFVIADHKFDVSFMRRHESNNCFQKMGIRLILMIAERRIRKTSTKENKIRISMILPHFRMCTIFFRVRILRYNYAVIVH